MLCGAISFRSDSKISTKPSKSLDFLMFLYKLQENLKVKELSRNLSLHLENRSPTNHYIRSHYNNSLWNILNPQLSILLCLVIIIIMFVLLWQSLCTTAYCYGALKQRTRGEWWRVFIIRVRFAWRLHVQRDWAWSRRGYIYSANHRKRPTNGTDPAPPTATSIEGGSQDDPKPETKEHGTPKQWRALPTTR